MAGHLVPSFFVFIEALPRSASGKVDRTELRERARPLLRDATSSDPVTETEALMVRIWLRLSTWKTSDGRRTSSSSEAIRVVQQ